MKKKALLAILAAAAAFSLASCGKQNNEHTSQITGSGADAVSPSPAAEEDAALPTADEAALEAAQRSADNAVIDESRIASTIAPAATAAPDAAASAQAKVDAAAGETNAVIAEEGGQRQVNLTFSLTNHTGIDFTALRLVPVNMDLQSAANLLSGQVFQNGMTLNIDPSIPEGTVLTTTLFNIVPIDANSRGYVFQNIDLSTSHTIDLYLNDGVPMAVVN